MVVLFVGVTLRRGVNPWPVLGVAIKISYGSPNTHVSGLNVVVNSKRLNSLNALGRNNTQILFFSTKIQMILIPTDAGLITLDYYSNWITSFLGNWNTPSESEVALASTVCNECWRSRGVLTDSWCASE